MPLKEAVICGLLVSQASSWVPIPPSGMPRHSVRRVPRYDYSRQSPRLDQISKRDLRATATCSLSPLAPSLDVSPSSVFRVSRFWSPTCFHASIRKDREVALSRGQAFMLASGGGNSEGISETGGTKHSLERNSWGSGGQSNDQDQESETRKGAALDQQIRLFVEMSTPFFKEDTGARWLLATVVALTLLNSGVSVAFSYIGRDFWTALSDKDPVQFNIMLQRFLLALTAGVPVTVFYRFERNKLALAWREWMTKRVMEIYYSGQTYYSLEASKEIDNPDQRIAEDVRAFTQVSLEFLITLLTSCIDLVSFSSILYSIYPELFIAIIAYASFGTFVTTKLGGKLVGLNFDQLQTEADFRYSLIRVRENAESIAFYGGVQQELKEIERRLGKALENFDKVIRAQRNLEFFTTGYRYLIQQVLPGFVVAPLFFQGKIQLGVVSQSYGAFNHILGDLSLIVNQFESLSAFSAGIDRLGEFLERMKGEQLSDNDKSGLFVQRGLLEAPLVSSNAVTVRDGTGLLDGDDGHEEDLLLEGVGEMSKQPSKITTETVAGAHLVVDDVTVVTPTGGRVLMKDLSFELGAGKRILVTGESGTGKSSLLRAIAGLWTTGKALRSGTIVRPTTEEMFFLPQRPYCTLGPLRDQITYPLSQGRVAGGGNEGEGEVQGKTATTPSGGDSVIAADDDELLALLKKVDLGNLAAMMGDGDAHAGLRAVRDWSDMLSLGEQQRLAFARLLYNKPNLAILDESTSALDLGNEAKMFALLDTLPGLSVMSVGHRPSLVPFHDDKLILTSKGYSIEGIGSERAEARDRNVVTVSSPAAGS
ncbi:unnamed protein product [Ascophyllum nodosum]